MVPLVQSVQSVQARAQVPVRVQARAQVPVQVQARAQVPARVQVQVQGSVPQGVCAEQAEAPGEGGRMELIGWAWFLQ